MFQTILKQLRNEKDLSQAELAKFLHLARSTIAQYETGDRTPDYDTLQRIADYFHVSTDYLLGRTKSRSALYLDETELSGLKEQYTPEEIEKNKAITMTLLDILIDTGVIQENEELSEEKRDYYLNILKQAIISSRLG